jgi:hypothetical protein
MALACTKYDMGWSDGKPFTFILESFAAAGSAHSIANFHEAELTLEVDATNAAGTMTILHRTKWKMIRAIPGATTMTVVVLATNPQLPASATAGMTLTNAIRGPVAMFKTQGTTAGGGGLDYEDLNLTLTPVQI